MNAESETNPAGNGWPVRSAPRTAWSWKKTGFLIALAFAIHLTLIFVFGTKKLPLTRTVAQAPQFQLAAGDSEWLALDDPTLFIVPHAQDVVPSVWHQITNDISPSFHWPEQTAFLQPHAKYLGAAFSQFMQTNRFAGIQFEFKPEPKLSAPFVPSLSLLPTNSTLQVIGELAKRPLLQSVNVPALPINDAILPSRVQVLVAPGGWVVSDVLLDSSGYGTANQMALKLARSLRFSPAKQLALGEVVFKWHTIPEPVAGTNTTDKKP